MVGVLREIIHALDKSYLAWLEVQRAKPKAPPAETEQQT